MSTVDGGGLSMKWWSEVSTCTSIMCGSDSKGLSTHVYAVVEWSQYMHKHHVW